MREELSLVKLFLYARHGAQCKQSHSLLIVLQGEHHQPISQMRKLVAPKGG